MSPALAKAFFSFVGATLPNLLSRFEDPMEALEELGKKWKEHRTHEIKDRSEEVEENRAEVDAKLKRRRSRKRKAPTKEG